VGSKKKTGTKSQQKRFQSALKRSETEKGGNKGIQTI
jgi:hypothetical protein